MGHYLSEMESDDEFRERSTYTPMRERLKRYDKEVERGLVHTDQWNEKMAKERATVAKWDKDRAEKDERIRRETGEMMDRIIRSRNER